MSLLNRIIRLLGARRLADILLLVWAAWCLLLLAWTQSGPLAIVQSIGTMWTFRLLYAAVAINLVACVIVETPRAWRRSSKREVPTGSFPPAGFTIVPKPWKTLGQATRALNRSLFQVERKQDRMLAERGRLAPLWGMGFHLLLPLLLPAIVWSVSSRRTVTLEVGEGESIVAVEGGPQAEIGVSRVIVEYLGSEIFFTKLEADIVVNGQAAGRVRINEPIGVDGGDLRIASMGYMPGLEVRDPNGRVIERAMVKADLFPPGATTELTFPGMPHRLDFSLFPDAERGEDSTPVNATLNIKRPLLKINAARSKIPVGEQVIALGEVADIEGFKVKFGDLSLWLKLEWVYDPGAKLAMLLLALALLCISLRILWPRTTWALYDKDGQIIAARRIEAFFAFANDEERRDD